ncbi:hypothetical protein QFC22_003445 [Naganishia vaughanmartiniae]|uniref:Uncharacterized protein n=1 Tax=Naganishia vaughanmartiniae TaxID=1424756 RepID=A0ACC2X811_9TREE|nr:hypothetical protein QFC22_003445 [Naganishia vaughanmartiniae]
MEFLDTFQPSETTPVMLTTEPISTLRDSLLPASEPEPSWWNQDFSSFRRLTELRKPRGLKTAVKLPEHSPHLSPVSNSQRGQPTNWQQQSLRTAPQIGSPLPESASTSRGLRARQMVQYTDSAVIKQELMDTSDEYFTELHRKHQMAEKKQKMIELDKMLQARNKLKGRIELLESTDDDVWRGHVERLLKRASRYTGDEVQTGHESDSSDAGHSKKERRNGNKQMTEDELAEKVYRLVLLAGIELVKTKSIAQLREELISEGKDLLEKYNKTLGLYVMILCRSKLLSLIISSLPVAERPKVIKQAGMDKRIWTEERDNCLGNKRGMTLRKLKQ